MACGASTEASVLVPSVGAVDRSEENIDMKEG